MTDVGLRGNGWPAAAARLQCGLDGADFMVDRVGHAAILVNDSSESKEHITNLMGQPLSMTDDRKQPIAKVVAANIRHYMDHGPNRYSSTTALAAKAGVSQKTVWNFLNPEKRLEKDASGTLYNMEQIATALGVQPYLLTQSRSAEERRAYEKIEQAYRILHDLPEAEDIPTPAERATAQRRKELFPPVPSQQSKPDRGNAADDNT